MNPCMSKCVWASGQFVWFQANLWTEFVDSEATAEYMLLPRLAAMAEALWSPAVRASHCGSAVFCMLSVVGGVGVGACPTRAQACKDYQGFCKRMALHEALYKAKGWRHRPIER